MIRFHLLVIDKWPAGQSEEALEIHYWKSALDTAQRVEDGQWPQLISSQLWLIEENAPRPNNRVLLWEWGQ